MLEISSKLNFNGQGSAANDDMNGAITMARTCTSVYDSHIKHALHQADKSALVRYVGDNYAAPSYVLHLRQAHGSPSQLVDDSCSGLGGAATCFQTELRPKTIHHLVIRGTKPSAVGIEVCQILGSYLVPKALAKSVKFCVRHDVSVPRCGLATVGTFRTSVA